MSATPVLIIFLCSFIAALPAFAGQQISWPNGAQVAVSLSYDDALDSHLDNAVPALDEHGFKASFYLTLTSTTIMDRLADWRRLAENGHELGNHTIYHPCSASLPERDWVPSYHDMDQRTVEQMQQEVKVANAFLHAIDGNTERTLTPPCGDLLAGGENYLPAVRDYFVAIKFNEPPPIESVGLDTAGLTGAELIAALSNKDLNGKLVHLIFHGVGAEHLSVSNQAHQELLQYLADNRDIYWVDTYLAIMKHALSQLPTPPAPPQADHDQQDLIN